MSNLIEGFEAFLLSQEHRSESTAHRYVRTAEAFVGEIAAGDEQLDPRRFSDVPERQLAAFLAGTRPSRSGWNNRLAAIRSFYQFLRREFGVGSEGLDQLRRQKALASERIPLDLREMLAIVDAAHNESPPGLASRNVALIQLSLHTAMRVSELSSLNVRQLDVTAHLMHDVRRKGGKRLPIELTDLAVEAIERYLPDRERILDGRVQRALFLSTRGTRLSVRAIQSLVRRYAEAANIGRPVSPHLLRHSAATELSQSTGLRVVQEICGHAAVTTTERYVHVRAHQRREAVDELARRWRAARTGATQRR